MYCIKCGQIIDDNARFCEHCGAQQTPVEAPAPQTAEAQAPAWQPSEPQPQQNWQPTMNTTPGGAVNGSTYLVLALLCTLFCCLPLGIAAIVYASRIDGCNGRGDYAGAAENAAKAKKMMIIGVVVSVVFTILSFALTMFTGISMY